MCTGQKQILRAICLIARAISRDIHLIRDVELRLAVFEGAGIFVCQIPVAQLRQRFHRCGGPETREPLVEIAFHSIFEDHRARFILALRPIGTAADRPAQKTPAFVPVDDARNVCRIDDDGALLLEDRDSFRHHLRLVGVEPAARLVQARRRNALVVEGARDSDPRTVQRVGAQELRVIASRRRRARHGRGIERIG